MSLLSQVVLPSGETLGIEGHPLASKCHYPEEDDKAKAVSEKTSLAEAGNQPVVGSIAITWN
jgi:hypothetical protein